MCGATEASATLKPEIPWTLVINTEQTDEGFAGKSAGRNDHVKRSDVEREVQTNVPSRITLQHAQTPPLQSKRQQTLEGLLQACARVDTKWMGGRNKQAA